MPIPAAIGIGASLLPSLMQLFGGGPKQANYSPEATMAMIQKFYAMLSSGPMGQQMLNQAGIAGNVQSNAMNANLARSGMDSTALGGIAGGGAAGLSAMNRQAVLAKLMEMAQGMTRDSQNGQTQTGQYDWNNPHGARAAIGSLGASLGPLLLGQSNKMQQPSWSSVMGNQPTGVYDPQGRW